MPLMPEYKDQDAWQKIQAFLPKDVHFDEAHHPVEEWWETRSHKIHLDRWRNPNAKLRVILHHGVGTNGRQMSMILGVPLLKAGYEAVAVDMPNYGMTQVAKGANVTYNDWVDIANDFVNAELASDPRPIVLYGLSAGGMLTYHVAAINPKVKGIIGMTFLDQRIQQVKDETSYNLFMSRIGVPLAKVLVYTPLAGFAVPMSLASKMWALANDPKVMRIFRSDQTSAASWATMRFLATYMSYQPAVEPQDFKTCPILLTQPAADKWTPLHLSEAFLSQIKNVTVKTVMLENAGHYPIEEPGLTQMHNAILDFLSAIQEQSD